MVAIPVNIFSPATNFRGPEQDNSEKTRFPGSTANPVYPMRNCIHADEALRIFSDNTQGCEEHRVEKTSGHMSSTDARGRHVEGAVDHVIEHYKGGRTITTNHPVDDLCGGHKRSIVKGDTHSETGGDSTSATGRHNHSSVGGNHVVAAKGNMAMAAKGDASFHAGGGITFKSDKGTHHKSKGDYNLETAGNITLSADGDVTIKAGGKVGIQASGGDLKLISKGGKVKTHGDQGTDAEGTGQTMPPTHFTPGPPLSL